MRNTHWLVLAPCGALLAATVFCAFGAWLLRSGEILYAGLTAIPICITVALFIQLLLELERWVHAPPYSPKPPGIPALKPSATAGGVLFA